MHELYCEHVPALISGVLLCYKGVRFSMIDRAGHAVADWSRHA